MIRSPRAHPRDLNGLARSVNILREALVAADATATSQDTLISALEARLAALEAAEAAPAETEETEETEEIALEQGNAVFDGADYLYVGFQDTDTAYTAHRYYFKGSGESQDDTVTGTGTAPATLVEFAAEAWPTPVP